MFMLTRTEAGRRLAEELRRLELQSPAVVALSPGGTLLGSEIARVLECPLDILAVVRLEVPGRARSTFGAVADSVEIILEKRVRQLGLPEDYVRCLVAMARREVARLTRAWRGAAPALPLRERAVILADDGLGDGLMLSAAATALKEQGAGPLYFSAPTAPMELSRALQATCTDQIFLYRPDAPVAAVVCDPAFAHTTGPEIPVLVRRSRPIPRMATPA